MKRSFLTIAFSIAILSSLAAADVLKLVINDTIHPITDEYIGRAIDQAHREKADAILIELRTPGGLVTSTRGIVEKILASEVPVIVYITPSGGYAASAGFFILQAADIAAMAPGTNTGAAHPILGGGEKMDDVLKGKMANDAAAFMRSFVNKRGRNVEVAESAVLQSKSFTEQEALDKKVIDVVAKDQADLMKQLDGRVIKRFGGESYTLHVAGKPVRPFEMTLKQQIMAFLMDPNIAYILFSLGMLALYGEFNNPGSILPGVVGTICVLLAMFAFNLLPVRFAAVAMIIGAFILFALEVKFTSHGVLGIGGTVLMVLGALLLVDAPIPEMRIKIWTALAVSIPIALISIFLMSIAVRAQRGKVVTGVQGMLGQVATVHTALTPAGKVFLAGELWNAVASAPVESGRRVVVRKVEGLQLEVEPLEKSGSTV
ncbi:MAG TPA: nodulation protein NfeD [Terriglobales bacterium]|nr:nodulation protein NfeD [Terriglobales bacterium]